MVEDRARWKMSVAYELGCEAYKQGIGECPYDSREGESTERIDWYNGWWDERHCQQLGFGEEERVGSRT
jgi:hypothetical protein